MYVHVCDWITSAATKAVVILLKRIIISSVVVLVMIRMHMGAFQVVWGTRDRERETNV